MSRQRSSGELAAKLQWLALALALGIVAGCTSAPEAPAVPTQVVALAERYENATAPLAPLTVRMIIDATLPLQAAVQSLAGLRFISDLVDDATTVAADNQDLSIELQGSLAVHAACPGRAASERADEAANGFIELMIGIEASRVQRAFAGRAQRCRILASSAGQGSTLVVTANLEVDLGASLALGDAAPALLIRATDLTGMLEGDSQSSVQRDQLDFRLARDGSLETLVELAQLGIGLQGSVVLALRSDGRVSLRVRDGEWICGIGRSDPCSLAG
jgi:hypothetical protein